MADVEDIGGLEQLLSSIDVPNVTKQQAVDNLRKIISTNGGQEVEIDKGATELLKCIEENYDKSDDTLSPSDKNEYHKITQVAQLLHNIRAMGQLGIEVGVRQRNVVSSVNAPLEALIEKQKITKTQLQDGLARINVLNQELVQVRSQMSSERIDFDNERASMREERNRERREREEEIRALKTIIAKLEDDKTNLERKIGELRSDKEHLERQIRDLRIQMEEEKSANERYKQKQAELVQKVSETNMREIAKLKNNVDELMQENSKLKTREPYKLVGYCVTLITNALYKFVHDQAQLRKNYYSIDDLENHIGSRYRGNVQGRSSAERRWEDIKEKIGWSDSTPALLNQLAENRERGPGNLSVSVKYQEFSEAVRVMFNDKELDQNEMESIRDLFVKCDDNLPMQPSSNN